jgi:hypothetical protein
MKVGHHGQWDRNDVCNEKEVAKGEGEKWKWETQETKYLDQTIIA